MGRNRLSYLKEGNHVSGTSLVVKSLLGKGSYSIIYQVMDADTEKQLAAKVIPKELGKEVEREIDALLSLKGHPNIIAFEKSLHSPQEDILLMEVFGRYDLFTYIQKMEQEEDFFVFSELMARSIYVQMVRSVEICHAHGIAHYDVKLENFMIDPSTNSVKLIDFGFARRYNKDENYNFRNCSPAYASPQILFGFAHDPQKVDVFSLGVCLFRMMCGEYPFCDPERDTLSSLKEVLHKRMLLQLPAPISPNLEDLLSKDLVYLIDMQLALNEEKRYSLQQLLRDPWLQKKGSSILGSIK